MAVESGVTPAKVPVKLKLYRVRSKDVILDRDLARLYGIATKRLNQDVKRYKERFPSDFAFQLDPREWWWIRLEACIKNKWGGTRYRPRVFTEQGVMMVASIMRGKRATALSIEILRAFAATRDERCPSVWEWNDGLLTDARRIDLLEREVLGEEWFKPSPEVLAFIREKLHTERGVN